MTEPSATRADEILAEMDKAHAAALEKGLSEPGAQRAADRRRVELEAADADAAEQTHVAQLVGPWAMVMDPSSGGKDRYTYGLVRWERGADARDFVRFAEIGGFDATIVRSIGVPEVLARIVAIGKTHGAYRYFADQRDRVMTENELRKHGVSFHIYDWTAVTKPPAVERVRTWLQEGSIALPKHETLRRELLSFEERISPSGQFTFGARGSGHDDYVSLLITAAMADLDNNLPPPGETAFDYGVLAGHGLIPHAVANDRLLKGNTHDHPQSLALSTAPTGSGRSPSAS